MRTSSPPYRRQPTASSHVLARATGDGMRGCVTGCTQPRNQAADEHGSIPDPDVPCFLQFCSTYTSPLQTSRGVASERAWYLSPHTVPVRPSARFTARAMRMASPWSPRTTAKRSSPSNRRCRWLPCTEKCTTRNAGRDATAIAPRTDAKTRAARSDGSPAAARSVT
jgi:hypothetical protein